MKRHAKAISELIERVEKESGVRKKETIIKGWTASVDPELLETLRKVLKYAYDDFIRFGVGPPVTPPGLVKPTAPRDISDPVVWQLLDHLRETQGSGSLGDKTTLIMDVLEQLCDESQGILLGIIDKNLHCGINESTVNKLFPKLLTVFDVMLAAPFSEKLVQQWPVRCEVKWDGMRVLARVRRGAQDQVTFYTRSGREQFSMEGFKKTMLGLGDAARQEMLVRGLSAQEVWFDGELITGSFNDTVSQGRKKDDLITDGTFYVFDIMPPGFIEQTDQANAVLGTFEERRTLLESLFADSMVREHFNSMRLSGHMCQIQLTPSYLASSVEEVWTFYRAARERKLEGLIVKSRQGLYVKKRHSNWMKMKAQETADLPVIGAFEGVGKYAGMLGGLIVDFKGQEVRVGGGFSDQQRRDLWAEFLADMKRIEAGNRDECELIDTLVEVEYQEVTPAGSLRHPTFVRRRLDKRAGDVSF